MEELERLRLSESNNNKNDAVNVAHIPVSSHLLQRDVDGEAIPKYGKKNHLDKKLIPEANFIYKIKLVFKGLKNGKNMPKIVNIGVFTILGPLETSKLYKNLLQKWFGIGSGNFFGGGGGGRALENGCSIPNRIYH